MAQLRSVNTKFWEDPWIEELTVTNKLLFLYLITNGYANLAGIYEITIKRISFETGIDKQSVSNGLELFAKDKKAYFVKDNYIFLPNWLKNQNLNSNMKKGVVSIIKALPIDVKISILGNDYQRVQKDYETVLNTLLKYEVLEKESEIEVLEEEEEICVYSFDDFWNDYDRMKGHKERCRDKFEKLPNNIKLKIKETIPLFKSQFSDKQFQPFPETYINQQRWNDVIFSETKEATIPKFNEFELFCKNIGKSETYIKNAWNQFESKKWKSSSGNIINWKETVNK